jgi:hypothetical protein
MAKRRQRHGVSGNPARRAGAAGDPAASGQRRRQSYVLGAALVVVALVVLLVPRPGEDPESSSTAQDVAVPGAGDSAAAPEQVQTTGAPRQATDEAFCSEFVAMANSQGDFVSGGETEPELLEQAADDLIAVGVPEAMSLPARTGYYAIISGVYDSIGMELSREAVGAAPTAVEGADAAFTAYLDANCPA